MTTDVPLHVAKRLQAEAGDITSEWLAGCGSSPVELTGPPPTADIVTTILAALGQPDPADAAAHLDPLADRLVEREVAVDVLIFQLGVLREVLQRRLARHLGPDTLGTAVQRLNRTIDALVQRFAARTTRRLENAAFLDPLTGLLNRRALQRDLSREMAQAKRASRLLSLIIIDVNGLKEINDRQGHGAGDRALVGLAQALDAALRGGDSAYRLGGDEFVVLLPDTPLDDVPAVVQRILASAPPSFSWGAATAADDFDADALVDAADRHLLERRRAAGSSSRSSTHRHRLAGPELGGVAVDLDEGPAANGSSRPATVGASASAGIGARPAGSGRDRPATTAGGTEGRWPGRPVAAAVVRGLAVAVPVLASLLTAWTLAGFLPYPAGGGPRLLWWIAVLAVSALSLVAFDRVARRLLPVAALLKLSMVFPDRAPSRLGVALRSGSTRMLQQRAVDELREGHLEPAEAARTILTLAASISAHDRGTRGHSERVRAYADLIAQEMGLSAADRDRLRWAALLHDVGKLHVPASTLNTKGSLTDQDWETLRSHPMEGAKLAAPIQAWLGPWAKAIEQHHERFDGSGYPMGLAGDDLTLAARIVAVADSYDAMTSVRSYSGGISAAAARRELARQAGAHFDPVVVKAFLNVALGRLRWVMGPVAFLALVPALPVFGLLRHTVDTVGRTAALGTVSLVSAVGLTQVVPQSLIPGPLAPEAAAPPAVRTLPPGGSPQGPPATTAPPGEESPPATEVAPPEPAGPGTEEPAPTTPSTGRPAGPSTSGGPAPTATAVTSPRSVPTTAPVTPTTARAPAAVCPTPAAPGCQYFFAGFFSPLSMVELNVVAAGSTVPLKWRLDDHAGDPVRSLDVVISARFSEPDDGASYKVTYDTENDQFVLIARTPRSWMNQDRTFTLTLDDGSTHVASFHFLPPETGTVDPSTTTAPLTTLAGTAPDANDLEAWRDESVDGVLGTLVTVVSVTGD
ncbi:MAG TPA: HD domain-containing phosphohydrolase [Acidimicrobiales bacterium]|nr:HD domain-containing phosphohydrolase [Acidimicrobiales bacterium]